MNRSNTNLGYIAGPEIKNSYQNISSNRSLGLLT